MATEVENAASLAQNGNVNGTSDMTGAAVLVVVGEPFSSDHREQILERITKGFKCWDVEASGCDINSELQAIATVAPAGEEGLNGERLVHHTSDCLQTDILINPQVRTVKEKVKALLLSPSKYKLIVYSGHAFEGTGEWILQDDRFSYAAFASIVKDTDVDNALKQHPGSSLNVFTFSCGDWNSNKIAKESYSKVLDVNLNADEKLGELTGVIQFTAYVSYFIKVKNPKDLLRASDVVGSIRFSKPTMYIFPGCQGDSALFGISGFNLLVNAGYNRKACFWDFTRHLDRIDAFLLTHLGADNILSVSAMMERKAIENVHPEIGFTYFNASDKILKHSPNGDISPENGGSHKPASLLINLVDEGSRLVENMKHLNMSPHPCHLSVQSNQIQPINLYHKVGHGSLDLYVLNPQQDGKEMKDFLAQWNKRVDNFTNSKASLKASGRDAPVPLPDMLSICALLVWRPASANENITRILFPGNTPQQKIFEGLDKLKNIDIFQQAGCQAQDLKAGNKKPAGKAPPKSSAKTPAPASARRPPSAPVKEPKVEKATKEIKNKKDAVVVNAERKKKSPASTPSSVKTTPTPEETATPIESPPSVTPSDTPAEQSPEPKELAQIVPEVQETEQQQPAEQSLVDLSIPVEPEVDKSLNEAVPESEPAPLVDNSLVDLSQNTFQSTTVESAEMPEADQDLVVQAPMVAPVVEPAVEPVREPAPELDSPEPLPDPNHFDSTSFVASQPVVQEDKVINGGIDHDYFAALKKEPELPVSQEPLVDINHGYEPVKQEPEHMDLKPVKQEPDHMDLEAANQIMEEQRDEVAPVETEPLIDLPPQPTDLIKEEEVVEKIDASLEQAFQPPVIADNPEFTEKQKLRELGIYDDNDEKDVDTAESEPQAEQPMSQQLLDEMGIYDREEPESQQPVPPQQADLADLRDQGVCFGDDDTSDENDKDLHMEPEADSHTHSSQDEGVCAESETESQDLGIGQELEAQRPNPDEQIAMAPGFVDMGDLGDVGGQPEADQAAYHNEVPQGLPSPREPVILPSSEISSIPDDSFHAEKCTEDRMEALVECVAAEEPTVECSEDDMFVPEREAAGEEDTIQRAQADDLHASAVVEQDSGSDGDSLDHRDEDHYQEEVNDVVAEVGLDSVAAAEPAPPVNPFSQADDDEGIVSGETENDMNIKPTELNEETLTESERLYTEQDSVIKKKKVPTATLR